MWNVNKPEKKFCIHCQVEKKKLIWFHILFRFPCLVLSLRTSKGTGFSKTETLILFQTSDLVGSWAIFSAISMSSGRTEPKTVYAFFHSWWLARLMKNSGPEPTQATEPLLMYGHSSVGIFLNDVPWASSVPWIIAKGGPKGAWKKTQKNKKSFEWTKDWNDETPGKHCWNLY